MKIYIDAGHGGYDSGAVFGKRCEKNDNLIYALELEKLFKEYGLEVITARRADVGGKLNKRTSYANKVNADVYLSCHRNGGGGKGIELWLHSRAPQSYIVWAKDMIEGFEKLPIPIRNSNIPNKISKGIFRGFRGNINADFAVNHDTNMPSMLIELGFMGNDDAAFDSHYKDYCKVIVRVTCKFLGLDITK